MRGAATTVGSVPDGVAPSTIVTREPHTQVVFTQANIVQWVANMQTVVWHDDVTSKVPALRTEDPLFRIGHIQAYWERLSNSTIDNLTIPTINSP